MAKKFLTDINLNKNQLLAPRLENLGTAPTTPVTGQVYFDTNAGLNTPKFWNGTDWYSMRGVENGDKGDITVSTTTTVADTWTIDTNAVDFSKIQNIATDTFLGRNTAATGNIEVLSMATATGMLDLFSTVATTQGLVPGSNGATTQFLRGDGTWASPAGGFADFIVGGDSGANQTMNDGDLLDITGGTGIDTTVSKVSTTVTLSVALDYVGTDNFIDSATNLEGTGIATGDTIVYHDATDDTVKKGFVSDLPFTNNAGTVTSVSAGDGMDFTTITGTGPVTMGTPGGLTSATIDEVTATSHTHSLNISGFASTVLSDTANIVYTNAARTITVTHTIDTGSKLTLTDAPVADTDAANKLYVDTVAQGLAAKDSVKLLSDSNLDLVGAETIDGVSTSPNDRILVTGQTAPAENGIYDVKGGAWTRAADANTWDELVSAFVFVEEGTTYGDTGWVCTVDEGGTLNTTAVTWAQFSGAGSYTAGNGLDLTGTVFTLTVPTSNLSGTSTNAIAAGGHTHAIDTGIANNDIVSIDAADVATGEYARFTANGLESRTAAEVAADIGVLGKYTVQIGDTSTTAFTITHNLGSQFVTVQIFETATPYAQVEADIELDSTTQCGINFNTAPGTNEYTVVVIG